MGSATGPNGLGPSFGGNYIAENGKPNPCLNLPKRETLTTPTMSSREIAELTGKQHKDVLYDIRKMLAELDPNGTGRIFPLSYKDSTGRSLPCYELPKRETLILVSGYSVPLRARIIDRWQELEGASQAAAAPALPNFSDPAEAARAWALAYEEKKKAEVALETAIHALR